MIGYGLPQKAVIAGKTYDLNTDFRDILEIFSYLENPDLPEYIRWQVALGLFFQTPLEDAHFGKGAEYFTWFVNCGREETGTQSGKVLDWERDAQLIMAGVNQVAGQEIRQLPYVHWWTFLSYFHAIGEGQLSTVVAIRQKRLEGKPLSDWEQEYYRKNKALVDLPRKWSREEQEEKARLMAQLGLTGEQ